jgi:hypothetical protein
MEQLTFDTGDESASASAGLCECGCGEPAPIAWRTCTQKGHVKGRPIRFIAGHQGRNGKGAPCRLFVEVGQRFGAAVVINPDVRLPGSRPNRKIRGARLVCDCGNEYDTWILNLVGSNAHRRGGKSCGCTDSRLRGRDAPRFVDRAGQRYGAIVVVDLAEPRVYGGKSHVYWLWPVRLRE